MGPQLIVFYVVVFGKLALSDDNIKRYQQKLANLTRECEGDILSDLRDSRNLEVLSLARCVLTYLGYLKTDGIIDKDTMRSDLSVVVEGEGKLDEIMEDCTWKGDDPEGTALEMLECIRKYTRMGKK